MGLFTSVAAAVMMAQLPAAGTAPTSAGATAFNQLQGLVGEWLGKRPDGRDVSVTYRLSAMGSVVVETWNLGAGRESLTIYHMNGPELMATHFCPQGNQPRLRMVKLVGNRFDFVFQDATGVKPGQGVQHEFWIDIGADDTITRSETYVQGDEPETETITYMRVDS